MQELEYFNKSLITFRVVMRVLHRCNKDELDEVLRVRKPNWFMGILFLN